MRVTRIALTRPGFEADLAREFPETETSFAPGSGWVLCSAPAEREPWKSPLLALLVFARQLFAGIVRVERSGGDLAFRAAEAAGRWFSEHPGARGVHSLFLETPDTEAGRTLAARLDPFGAALEQALAARNLVRPDASGAVRLHAFFPSADEAWLGVSSPRLSSPWPSGIPRLRLPADAPSRSARKLEEAILVFLPERERLARLSAGMRAVDLGAAPGGWSWVLAGRGLRVEAVDNGPLAPSALESGLVTHVRADGFTYRPARSPDWMVCDMLTGGARTARLAAHWLERGLFRESIFNLKLGGADRLKAVKKAEQTLLEAARRSGAEIELRFRHLYHDRDEVTAHVRVLSREAPTKKTRVRPIGERGKAPQPRRGRSGARTRGK